MLGVDGRRDGGGVAAELADQGRVGVVAVADLITTITYFVQRPTAMKS